MALIGLLGALLLVTPARADVEIYEPRGRTAEELEPLAGALLGDRGQVIADRASGRLVLRGSRAALDEVLHALRRLDHLPASFSVELRLASRDEAELLGFEVTGRTSGVRIGRRRDATGPRGGIAVELGATSAAMAERVGARVSVLEGRDAEVWTGTSYPVGRTHVWRRHPGGATRSLTETELVPVRRGFRVRARAVEGELVELALQPIFETGNPEDGIAVTSAETRVRVRLGELVAIAGVDEHHDERGGAGLGGWKESGRGERVLLVRVSPAGTDRRP